MKLEETIQTILDKHPFLFGDRESVLVYLYCYFGTGFEWVDGELVSEETKGKFKGNLNKNGMARQKLSEEKSCIKFIYDSEENNEISYIEFQKKIKEVKERFIERGKIHHYSKRESIKVYEDNVLQPYLDRLREVRKKYIDYVDKMSSEKYSPVYNPPKDIKEDWLQGLNEVKKLINLK